jgi:hypothetical protein
MIETDFPHAWDHLLGDIVARLTAFTDQNVIIPATLFILQILFRAYEYRSPNEHRRDPLYTVIDATFPTLLKIFEGLRASTAIQSAEMQILLCKIFWCSIQVLS